MGSLMFDILRWALALTGVWLVSGTLMNFSSHPHWYIRGWDFPRVVTAALALIVAAAWASMCSWQWWDWAFLASLAGVIGVQVWNIYPYTPLARQQVLRTERMDNLPTSIRLVATNVLMENREFAKWRDVIRAANAWDGQGCLVVHMAPQPAGRVLNQSDLTLHGIRIEMKN